MLFNFSLFQSKKNVHKLSGFGLIELMVSISIMTLVSAVILVKNRSFNNALLLRNQAYEVAFSLREAQLLAVSGTREVNATTNQYGIHFTAGSGQYRMFRDDSNSSNDNSWYDAGDTSIGVLGVLDKRYLIDDIVDSSGNSLSGTALSVTFVRPNFDAVFKTSAGTVISGPAYLKIVPVDTSGFQNIPYRLVEITGTGQISVI